MLAQTLALTEAYATHAMQFMRITTLKLTHDICYTETLIYRLRFMQAALDMQV